VKRESNEGGLIPRAFFVRSPGGHTAAPSGLYARLCHAFLVNIVSFLTELLKNNRVELRRSVSVV